MVPRELIFQNRSSLDDYDVDNNRCANSSFFEQMLNMDCLKPQYKETESQILAIFNDVYYILTMIFLEKRPILRLGYYREIARLWPGNGVRLDREIIVLSIIFEILGVIRQDLPNSVIAIKDELGRYLSTQQQYKIYRFSIMGTVDGYYRTDFSPRVITQTIANKIDWVKLTDNFNLEIIQELFTILGQNNIEKKIIVKAIFNAEAATGNVSAIPYEVDKLLDKLHREVDENHLGILDAYDARRESINLDTLMEKKIEEYMGRNAATDEDIEKIFEGPKSNPDAEQLLQQIAELKAEVNHLLRERDVIEKNHQELVTREAQQRNENNKVKAEKQGLLEEVSKLKQQLENNISEKAFNATGNECFTKAKMGLLIYTIASIKDGPTPIKAQLVPIISAIGGWETTSVSSEMKKAGFNQSDIDAVANLFKDVMPNFAEEIKKQIARRPKEKK